MNAWIDPRLTSAVNAALLHSIWQCAAIAAALWLMLRLAQHPRFRYTASVLALLVAAAVFAATLARSLPGGTKPNQIQALPPSLVRLPPAASKANDAILASKANPSRVATDAHDPLARLANHAATAWVAGILLLSAYHGIGWWRIKNWRNEAVLLRNGAQVEGWQTMARRLNLRRSVEVAESRHVQVPSLIGLFRPMILLPLGALTGLDPRLLDALVAHELAHLRRHDGWMNLLQISLETLLFYHPAVWWIGRQIRVERECCCDELAATLCGDRRLLAEALTGLAAQQHAPSLLLASTDGPLLRRVRRLLDPTPRRPLRNWVTPLLPAVVVAAFIAVHLSESTNALAQPATTKPTTQTTDPNADPYQQQLNQLKAERDERARVVNLLLPLLKPDDPALLQAQKVYVVAEQRYAQATAEMSRRATTRNVDPVEQAAIAKLAADFGAAQLLHYEAERKFGVNSPQVRDARLKEEDCRHAYRRAREASSSRTGRETHFSMQGVKEPGGYVWSDRPITLPEALLFGGMWSGENPTITVLRGQMQTSTNGLPHTVTGGRIVRDIPFSAADALGDKGKAFVVESGDEIIVSGDAQMPTRPLSGDYTILGDVVRPGLYEYKDQTELLQALRNAGVDAKRYPRGRVLLQRLHRPPGQAEVYPMQQLIDGLHVPILNGDTIIINLGDSPSDN